MVFGVLKFSFALSGCFNEKLLRWMEFMSRKISPVWFLHDFVFRWTFCIVEYIVLPVLYGYSVLYCSSSIFDYQLPTLITLLNRTAVALSMLWYGMTAHFGDGYSFLLFIPTKIFCYLYFPWDMDKDAEIASLTPSKSGKLILSAETQTFDSCVLL